MNSKHRLVIMGIALLGMAGLLTACGGGGGGSSALATGTFVKGITSTLGTNVLPFSSSNINRTQNLYLATEIQGSGTITELQMLASAASAASTCPNMTVKLGIPA